MADIIDSHIHLFPADELDSLSWLTPNHTLGVEHSPAEYAAAVSSSSSASSYAASSGRVAGFVVVEAARKFDLAASPPDYSGPLAELAYLRRVLDNDNNDNNNPKFLAVVPWAPLPLGAAAVEAYLAQAETVAGPEVWRRVRAFRYLVQDEPAGTMLGDGFVKALRWLGSKGFAFDLGVDARRRDRKQHLEEAVEMVGRAHDGVPEGERVTIIINHLLKPDLSILNPADPAFDAWRTTVYALSCYARTYLKLSGCFGGMPASVLARDRPADVADAMLMWLGPVLAAFGPERIMFGSDWPVCNVSGGGGGGSVGAWERWRGVVERMVWMGSLDERGLERVWGGTAREAYGIGE